MKPRAKQKHRQQVRVAVRPFYNPINPYNSLLHDAVSASGSVTIRAHEYLMLPSQFDILHLHWPNVLLPRSARPLAMLKTAAFWMSLLIAHFGGAKIVWTAHNVFPHDREPRGANLFLWRLFLSTLDGVIFLSEESQRYLTAQYSVLAGLPSTLVKHGHYGPWIESVRKSLAAPAPDVLRTLDDLKGAFVVLNFGTVQPYKNVDELMRHFSALPDAGLRLLVAGRVFDAEYLLALEALARVDRRIVLLQQHLDDASLVACLDRADLVVLPYRKILNSGSALTAMSFGKHVVVPAIGSMPSLQRDVGRDALTLYEGQFNADILRVAIDRVQSKNVTLPNLDGHEWPLLGAQVTQYYSRLINSLHLNANE